MASPPNSSTAAFTGTAIRPFEWLTGPASLGALIRRCVFSAQEVPEGAASSSSLQALHVGCGSSTAGEFLVRELDFGKVVNIDCDKDVLHRMERRWWEIGKDLRPTKASAMEFLALDFTKERLPERCNDSFDLVLDKSTLDCTLCSNNATASLLLEVHRTLKADGGVYIVVSFHELDLLLPLLRDTPGAAWNVEHTTMARQLEPLDGTRDMAAHTPTDNGKPLNVLICRRNRLENEQNCSQLDFGKVCEHVRRVTAQWFKEQQPLLTEDRIQKSRRVFGEDGVEGNGRLLTLVEAFLVLFTKEEREHFTFEHFLESWEAFQESRNASETGKGPLCVSFEIAVEFLKEMQR